jgi:septal ring factor EnvC (AmiA/AmiB activator)
MTRHRLICVLAVSCAMYGMAAAETRVEAPPGGGLAERYQRAQAELAEARAKADSATADRNRVAAEERALQQKLIETAARLQQLERAAPETAAELDRLREEIAGDQANLAHDRAQLTQVLAVMQRIRVYETAGLVSSPDHEIKTDRAALQAGGAMKALYLRSMELRNHLVYLTNLRSEAGRKEAETASGQRALADTRDELDRLIAAKRSQSDALSAKAQDLQKVADEIGREAGDLKNLMDRVASLRATTNDRLPRVKTIGSGNSADGLVRGALRPPVPGAGIPGDPAGPGMTPGSAGPAGLWFEGSPRGEAVAPGDSEVVFAGNYQKLGQVLILELSGGYHLALAGLGRINVHVGDLVLAGEPVGTLPEGKAAPLYMELRRNGKVVDLAPYMSADIGKAKRS